jgi:ABC-type glutathione transport system ATPase component
VVGQSGSGKTTLGNCLAGLLPVDAGTICYQDQVVAEAGRPMRIPRVDGVQMVYQDPYSTLNPRRSVGSVLREILTVHRLCARQERQERCEELVEQVGLDARVLRQRPAQLSGGMCQRIAIARALAFRPKLLIADEIVSALDASVQAQVLNLVADLRDSSDVAIVFITHDLSVVNQLCDRVLVMHRGRIVEQGPTRQVLTEPTHDYTAELIAAVPTVTNPESGAAGPPPEVAGHGRD